MNILESKWLGERMAAIPPGDLFPLLNVGSSTLEFRTRTQPWIDEHVFRRVAANANGSAKVIHLDMKADPGVDLVGNLLDPAFLERVAQLQVRSAMASNLFEHVTVRREICEVMLRIVPSGGYIILSGPQQYPYHADPIDTMFRPTVQEMADHFPGTTIVDSAVIDSGNWRQWHVGERGRSLARTVARLMVPVWKPKKWWELARQSPYLLKHITAFAVILRKN